ncbi:MAG: YbaB/EbfC family nucleoid-associated protein, partial [Planctomycetota bacterium]
DLGNIMKHAQKMQQEMAKIQEDLKNRVVEGKAGGGMVVVNVNGAQELLAVKIDKNVVDPEDVEMLEDLITAAVREGMRKAKEMANKEMSKLTGGLNLPGLL